LLLTRLKKKPTLCSVFQKLSYISLVLLNKQGRPEPFKARGECRKAIRVGKTQINQLIMEQNSQSNPLAGLHKQKLYALIVAAVGVISCILPWWKVSYGGFSLGSINGLHELGWLTFLGFIGAGVVTFVMGDKTKPYEGQEKMIAMACFGVAGAVALIQFLRQTKFTSFGLYLAILAGAAGLLWIMGIIKLPENKK
jgi:hypothetical protein